MDGAPAYGHIVVGVDGSPTSRAALRWAAREAELRQCTLEVVYGWQVKGEPRPPGDWGGVAPPIEAYQAQAQARIQAIVEEVLPNGAACEMRVHAMHKPAGRALLSFCATADLLVVGAKERGRLAGWLVGSTSDDALKNASCTVVVVRPRGAAGATDRDAASGERPVRGAADDDEAGGDAAAGERPVRGATTGDKAEREAAAAGERLERGARAGDRLERGAGAGERLEREAAAGDGPEPEEGVR